MNKYEMRFFAKCPTNGTRIEYRWVIETKTMIFVEDLIEYTDAIGTVYHEDLADCLAAAWGGQQTLCAFHHGVEITTTRGRA